MLARRQMCQGLSAAGLLLSAGWVKAAALFDPARTVRQLAEVTRSEYHDPVLGGTIARRLLEGVKRGTYRVSTPQELASRLTAEIAAVSKDAHFVVMAGDMMQMASVRPTQPHQATPALTAGERTTLKRANFGITAVEILPGNIGRVELAQFYRPVPEVRERLALAMGLVADTAGLIVDLSRNVGGDPHSVALLLSYFFDREPFAVNRFRWRNLPVEEFRTTATPGGALYGEQRPLAVLVSRNTFSAAEEFAYDVQATKRGIIVGERTPGAANHALPVELDGGLTAFIPKARAENPVTGANWEGVGVAPDVPAAPATIDAASKALTERLAGQPAGRLGTF